MDEYNEIWKAIPGCDGRYDVSSLGRVRSHLRGGRILKQASTSRGYRMVAPVVGKSNMPCRVHHLVLLAFVGPRPDGHVACHANDVPHDNRLENLRWDTPENNIRDRLARGVYSSNQKLTAEKVVAILRDPRGHLRVSREYGVNKATIRDIRRGVMWKQIPR